MLFAHDTEVALVGTAALVNTAGPPEALAAPADLAALVREQGWTGRVDGDEPELVAVQALRPRLRGLWSPGEGAVVELVNALLAEAGALPQLVRHDAWDWHLHASPPSAPLADRMAVEAAMAVVDVVRAGELERLRTCAADGCDDVLVDLSRNRSRRFCEGGCGNRAAVAAYRARRAAVG